MYRIRGTVKLTGAVKKFAIVIGDDGREYFSIPSLFRFAQAYSCIRAGSSVEFDPTPTPQGWRAMDVTVLSLTAKDAATNGEESRL
jgi:hypothetical protein